MGTWFNERNNAGCGVAGDTIATPVVSAAEVWFEKVPGPPGKLHVKLHLRGLTPDTVDKLVNASIHLIDNAVGEYDAVMSLDMQKVVAAPDRPEEKGLIPLSQLAKAVDAAKK